VLSSDRLSGKTGDGIFGQEMAIMRAVSAGVGEGLRVVLVEDDPDHAELVRRGLEAYGSELELTHLSDGESALQYLKDRGPRSARGRPHLILLDLRLPRMDGLELLREIKAMPDLADIPCVVLTTSRAEGDMMKAYRLHANSYLVKPPDYARFVELISGIERYWLRENVRPEEGAAPPARS
jgi:CheY-like chemotaxis protein